MSLPGRTGLLVAGLVLASLALGGPAVATPGDVEGAAAGPQRQLAQPTATNDTTRHAHPERVRGEGDLAAVKRWLVGRMAVRLEQCVVDLGFGSTDVCELDDQYPDWLERYVDVAEETADEDDDRRAQTLAETKADHEAYARATANFTRTYEAYQQAKAAGDDERARALARELQRLAGAIRDNGSDVTRTYADLEAEAGVSLDDATASVNATLANVSSTVAAVEAAEFTPTRLTAAVRPRALSFLEPGTVAGRLTTATGTALADRRITLVVGDRTLTTRTDGAGRFRVEYRPTTIPLSTDRLAVRYQPAETAPYLGNRTTVPISINQVEPRVRVSVAAGPAAFGDEVRVTGAVAASGLGASGVPVRVQVDGRPVGTVHTSDAGRFAVAAAVGPTDGPGSVDVAASVVLEGRALASATGTTTLRIQRSPTAMTVTPEADGPRQVTVSGQLTTRDGTPVPGQPVTLLVNGTAVEAVRTSPDGTYRASLAVPSSLTAGDRATPIALVARFDGQGTNLEPSQARGRLTLPADPAPNTILGTVMTRLRDVVQEIRASVTASPVAWGLGGLGLLLVVLLGTVGARVRSRGDRGVTDPVDRPDGSADTVPTDEPAADHGAVAPMEPARARLDADADDAVMLAYATVRDRLAAAGRTSRGRAETHWEFLAACRQDGLEDDAIEGLTALTETYEAAAYAPTAVTRADAEAAISAAERLV